MTVSGTSVPCAVMTGALGSGKTTVIRELMERPDMAGTALVINEFGEVGLDHLLVATAVETTLLMENGCMCCSLRGDLVDTVMSLFGSVERGEIPPFRRILIETTGLADPVPIVRDLTSAGILRGKVHLAGVTTCVDSLIGQQGVVSDPVAVAQVVQADTCVLTKTDLADPLRVDELREALVRLNPMMQMLVANEGALSDAAPVFGRSEPAIDAAPVSSENDIPGHDHHDHDHGAPGEDSPHGGIDSWSFTVDRPLNWSAFRDWFDFVYSLNAARLLRMKGILWITERERPLLVQAVGPIVAPLRLLDAWPGGRRETRLVMISKDLSRAALETSFRETVLQCHKEVS